MESAKLNVVVLSTRSGAMSELVSILRHNGHRVVEVSRAGAASSACRHDKVDAIVLRPRQLDVGALEDLSALARDRPLLWWVAQGDSESAASLFGGEPTRLELLRDDANEAELRALLARLVRCSRADGDLQTLNRDLDEACLQLDSFRAGFQAFSQDLSHELNGILKDVELSAAALEVLVDSKLQLHESLHLRRILNSTKHGFSLLRDLVTLARIPVVPADMALVDLEALVLRCQRELSPAGRSLAWRTDSLPKVPGDQALLEVAMRQLLANAVKFTREREVATVVVRAIAQQDGFSIQVSDNGVGFEAASAWRLFKPLQRLHSVRQFEGNGLGLAMVKAVADRHGGRVTGHSPAEGGAVFSLWLPLQWADRDATHPALHVEPVAAPAAPVPAVSAARDNGRKLSVLLVDDEVMVVASLRAMLEREGHEVSVAGDGAAAIAALRAHPRGFDVLVTDCLMPGIGGLDVAAAAKRLHGFTRTIVLTGSGSKPPVDAEAGTIDATLPKPVRAEVLCRALFALGEVQ